MKESVKIRNLGPLRDIEISDIRPMTVLIGPSGSGKSLLMKTLILFRYIYKMLNIRWYLRNSNINKSPFSLAIANYLTPELRIYFEGNDQVEIIYSVEVNGRVHSIIYRDKAIERRSIEDPIPNEDLIFLKESWVSEMRNLIPEWAELRRVLVETKKTRNQNFYFLETWGDFMAATDKMTHIPVDYLGLTLNVEKKGAIKEYYIAPADGSYAPIEWKFSSSGAQTSSSIPTLVKYFSSIFSFKEAINRSIISYLYESDTLKLFKPDFEPLEMKKMVHIHVEEPELNLFPDAQCHLMDDMARELFQTHLPDRELRMIIATHSPYIVNYLNVLIHQNKEGRGRIAPDDLAVYRMHEGSLQPLMAKDENNRKFVDTYDLTEQMEAILNEYDQLTTNQ